MTKQLDDLLSGHRDAEDDRDSQIVIGDDEATRVLAAWSRISTKWKKPSGKPPADEHQRWLWLWMGASYDLQQLTQATRLTERQAVSALRACVLARLVYPDGTISDPATKAVDARKGKRKPGRPPKDES